MRSITSSAGVSSKGLPVRRRASANLIAVSCIRSCVLADPPIKKKCSDFVIRWCPSWLSSPTPRNPTTRCFLRPFFLDTESTPVKSELRTLLLQTIRSLCADGQFQSGRFHGKPQK